jgi:hypothetical protein
MRGVKNGERELCRGNEEGAIEAWLFSEGC